MTSLLQKRRKEVRAELVQIEKQIYDLETSYLEETKDYGNIFTGWDSYLSGDKGKTKKTINNEDRHFSLSSITSPASKREENKKAKPNENSGTAIKKSKKAKIDKPEGSQEEQEVA